MKRILGLIMAVTIALSLNACTFTDHSETSNMVDESVSVDQGGQVIRVDIPNGDGTFTTLEGEEAQNGMIKQVKKINRSCQRSFNAINKKMLNKYIQN